MSTVSNQAIANIARQLVDLTTNQPLFKTVEATLNGTTIHLKLDSEIFKYESRIDEIVKNAGVNTPLVTKLQIALRKYSLKTIKLEPKIIKIVEKTLNPPKDKVENANQPVDIKAQAEALFKAGSAASEGANGQNIVLFIGDTGVGKSTTINDLMNCKMKKTNPENLGVISPENEIIIAENPVTAIGHKFGNKGSKTKLPKVIADKNHDLAYCDCAGFKDTQGKAEEIYNALCIKDVIQKSKSVKGFLFFIEYPALRTGEKRRYR